MVDWSVSSEHLLYEVFRVFLSSSILRHCLCPLCIAVHALYAIVRIVFLLQHPILTLDSKLFDCFCWRSLVDRHARVESMKMPNTYAPVVFACLKGEGAVHACPPVFAFDCVYYNLGRVICSFVSGNLNAALTWRDGRTFFFKGELYWRFTDGKKMDKVFLNATCLHE